MLAFMVLGALLTRVLLRTKKTLQREPYSIAGRAVLVVGGNMLLEQGERDGEVVQDENVENDAAGGDVRSVHEKGVGGEEKRYYLGWSKDAEGRNRYGICVER